MCAQRSKESQRQRAFELLAEESQVPIDEVTQRYENEFAKNSRSERALPVFSPASLCDVRKSLLGRANGERPPE